MIEMKRREAEESMQSIEDKLETALKTGEKINAFLTEHNEEIECELELIREGEIDEDKKSPASGDGRDR